jgi:hypothetical protein
MKNKMKKLLYVVASSAMLTIFGCKKESYKTATVIMDCTGTYLRMEGKDYKVCNLEKVSSLPSGTTVVATFKKITECKGSGNFSVTCLMYHEYDSWIEVEKIK